MESLLLKHPFTNGMKANYVKTLAACASELKVPAGEYVLRQGKPAKEFYLILNGIVELELFSATGGPVILEKLQNGSVLGWSWLVPPCMWHFDARTLQPLTAIKIDAIHLRNRMDSDPVFGYEILKRFIEIIGARLESERMRLVELYASHS